MGFIKKGNVRLDERNVQPLKNQNKGGQKEPATTLKTTFGNPYVSDKKSAG